MTQPRESIVIALSKGRILEQTLPLLAAAGVQMTEDPEKTRKLVIDTSRDDVKVVIVRATDVPTYVQHGAADVGVAGKDVLMEHGGAGLYEPLDLQIARCKLMVAGWPGTDLTRDRLRIATKFVHITEQYYASLGRQVELVKLYGSMELAPIVGLADAIVDLVDTGNTLRANGLEPLELITHISSRLIVNQAASKMKHERIQKLVTDLDAAVRAREPAPGDAIA